MEINKEVVKRELRRKLEREINGSRWLEATNGLISIRKRNLHKKYTDFTLSEIEGLICERLAQEYEAAKAKLDCINNHFSHWFTGQGYMADVSEGVVLIHNLKSFPVAGT